MREKLILSFHALLFTGFMMASFFHGAISEGRRSMLERINCEQLLMMSVSQLTEFRVRL